MVLCTTYIHTTPLHRPGVDCPQSLVKLYLDCTALEAEKRPTAPQLYSRLHAIVFEEEGVVDGDLEGSAKDHAAVPRGGTEPPASGMTEAPPLSLATTAFFADDDSDVEAAS